MKTSALAGIELCIKCVCNSNVIFRGITGLEPQPARALWRELINYQSHRWAALCRYTGSHGVNLFGHYSGHGMRYCCNTVLTVRNVNNKWRLSMGYHRIFDLLLMPLRMSKCPPWVYCVAWIWSIRFFITLADGMGYFRFEGNYGSWLICKILQL